MNLKIGTISAIFGDSLFSSSFSLFLSAFSAINSSIFDDGGTRPKTSSEIDIEKVSVIDTGFPQNKYTWIVILSIMEHKKVP